MLDPQTDFTEVNRTPDKLSSKVFFKTKSKLTERDLLRMCIDNPKYLGKVLGHNQSEGTGISTIE